MQLSEDSNGFLKPVDISTTAFALNRLLILSVLSLSVAYLQTIVNLFAQALRFQPSVFGVQSQLL